MASKTRYLLIILLLLAPISFALVCDYSDVEAEYLVNNAIYDGNIELDESFTEYCNNSTTNALRGVATLNVTNKSTSNFANTAAKTVTAPFLAAGFVLLAPTAAGYSLMDSKAESSTLAQVGYGVGGTIFVASIPLAMAGFILALPAIPFWFFDK